MATTAVRSTVSLTIADGKFEAFEAIALAMLAGSRKEPGTLGYDGCLGSDRRTVRLLETYADANAVVAHLTGPVVQQFVPQVLGVASLDRFEVYGDRGPQAAAMLAGFGATIFAHWHAF